MDDIDILLMGKQELKQVCDQVDPNSPELEELSKAMIATMHNSNGVGLAANQIGLNMALFVANLDGKDRTFLNPTIRESFGEQSSLEGCLSVPTIRGVIKRPKKIVVEFATIGSSQRTQETFENYNATIISHEIDHLNGKLFIARMGATDRRLSVNKFNKLLRTAKKLQHRIADTEE